MFNNKENDELFLIPMSSDAADQTSGASKASTHSDRTPEIVNRFFPTKTKVKQYNLTPLETRAFLRRWHTYLDKGEYRWSTYHEANTGRSITRCGIPVAEALYFMTELQFKDAYDQIWIWVDEGAVELEFCMYDN